jgi:hypothetical protein
MGRKLESTDDAVANACGLGVEVVGAFLSSLFARI